MDGTGLGARLRLRPLGCSPSYPALWVQPGRGARSVPLKRGTTGAQRTPPIQGRACPRPPSPAPPSYPRSPVPARRRAGRGEAWRRGHGPCTSHTTALGLPHPRGRLEPGDPRASAAVPFPSSGIPGAVQHRGPPWKQRRPPPLPRPPAFPPPVPRTQANCQAAPATSEVLPGPRLSQAPGAQPVPWGSCGGRIPLARPRALTMVSALGAGEAAPTERHGRGDPGGGCSGDSATGPQRQHRAGMSAAVSARLDCHLLLANGKSSRRGLVAAS